MIKEQYCRKNTDNEGSKIIPEEKKIKKIAENVKVIAKDAGETLGAIPELAKDIFKSADKSEVNYNEFIKSDKAMNDKVIDAMLKSDDYTKEEIFEIQDRNRILNEDVKKDIEDQNEYRLKVLGVVVGGVTSALVAAAAIKKKLD